MKNLYLNLEALSLSIDSSLVQNGKSALTTAPF